MLDRLIEVLVTVWRHLIPFFVLDPFEQGVLIRLGQFKRVLEPGFHWCIPLGVDTVYNEHVTPRTDHIQGLSTTTRDDRSVAFDVVITWRISDIRKALMDVTDLKDAIADTCAGQVSTALASANWELIRTGGILDDLTSICRKRGWKWGVEIMSVQLSGVTLTRNLRISHSGMQPAHLLVPGAA